MAPAFTRSQLLEVSAISCSGTLSLLSFKWSVLLEGLCKKSCYVQRKTQQLEDTWNKVKLNCNKLSLNCALPLFFFLLFFFLLSSHLKFSNLTLISTHGLPGKKLLGTEQRKFLASEYEFYFLFFLILFYIGL